MPGEEEMRAIVRLAWRNLWRHPQRTALAIAIVAFGTFCIIVVWGITEGWIKTMTHAQVSLDQGHLKIFAAGYRADPALEKALASEDLHRALSELARFPGAEAAPRLTVYGMLKSAYGAAGVEIRGVDPEREPRVTEIPRRIVAGAWFSGPGQILLGQSLAEELDVRLGERVVVLVQGARGPRSQAFRAVGFFASGLPGLDKSTVLIPLEDARAIAGVLGATEVVVRISSGDPATLAARLQEALGERFEVRDFFSLNPLIRDMVRVAWIELTPMIAILALLSGFGVANTVLFSVLQRTRELGIMAAVGMSPRTLARMVLMESLLSSALGYGVGAGAGYGVNLILATRGVSFGEVFGEMLGRAGMPAVLYSAVSGWYWLGSLSVVLATGLVAAWYPARRAARLSPVEAIREG
ncbi:ABC transporter permease [Candidatus Bipolaricaulota bacterium]|nr:ABC transporter permease [Candidatus Bipolaricaulota bacterium]